MKIFARFLSSFVFLIFVVACSENPLNGTWVVDAKETEALLKKESPDNLGANIVVSLFTEANAKIEIDGTNVKIIMGAVKGMIPKGKITEETGKLVDGSLVIVDDGKDVVLSISGDQLLMKMGQKGERFAVVFSKQ